MAKSKPRPHEQAGTGAEDIPPGATRKALDRSTNPPGGAPGSGAGPLHASGDPGDGKEFSEVYDRHRQGDPTLTEVPAVSDDELVEGRPIEPYSGPSGGAVGGSPAEGRSSGGNIHRGIAPGATHRGDSTIGTDPGGRSRRGGGKGRKKKK
jgi:hypothetical protein